MIHPPRLDLERLAAGESVPDADAHVENCAQCAVFVEQLKKEQEALLCRKPGATFMAQLSSHKQVTWSFPRLIRIAPAFAAASIAALLIGVLYDFPQTFFEENDRTTSDSRAISSGESLHWRGGPIALSIFTKDGDSVSVLENQKPMPGDKLRFELTVPGEDELFAALVAVEGGSILPVLPPEEKERAYRIEGNTVMPGSVEIAPDTTSLELLLVVRSTPYPVSQLLEEIRLLKTNRRPLTGLEGLIYYREVTP